MNSHRSKELLMRWAELGAFTVVFRTHEGNRPGVNHQIYSDGETLRHFDRFAKVYAAWTPYRTKLVEEAVEVYLPAGRWVHLWSDKEYGSLEGGVYESVPAPVGEPTVFYKEGSEAGRHMTVELDERGLLDRFSR
ncbi:MAG TPA: hypothetical protein VFV45_04050 [Rubrobacteraceae bacterium]|nr:hypothetical protein [Rubrobacteraceae bacterium]